MIQRKKVFAEPYVLEVSLVQFYPLYRAKKGSLFLKERAQFLQNHMYFVTKFSKKNRNWYDNLKINDSNLQNTIASPENLVIGR